MSRVVGIAAVISAFLSCTCVRAQVPAWFPKAPPLAAATGTVIRVTTVDALLSAAEQAQPGATILVEDGLYRLPRTLVLSGRQRVTIRGASGDPARVTLVGKGWGTDARTDDILHIGRCDQITIADLTFADARTYAIKVEAENAPRAIEIYNCRFRDIGVRAIKGSAGKDPAVRAVGGSVRFCRFQNTKLPPGEWLFGGDYVSAIDMMALEDWTFSDNVFQDIKGRSGGGRAAIFIWVRSRRVTVERNVILNCDRGIAFGNPGVSTANIEGEQLAYVSDSTIRNNFIAGGADCGVELWHVTGIGVFHNSIWRPERNWSRGIRVGKGTRNTHIANNLVHGEISMEGGLATLQTNQTGRLEEYFVSPSTGDLRLTDAANNAIDRAAPLSALTEDIRRHTRGTKPDLGAWEK